MTREETLVVDRLESMSVDGKLTLYIQPDGDVIITIYQTECGGSKLSNPRMASLEFCTPITGGGGSANTHLALRNLAIAMAKDNADNSQTNRAGRNPGTELLDLHACDVAGSELHAAKNTIKSLRAQLEKVIKSGKVDGAMQYDITQTLKLS